MRIKILPAVLLMILTAVSFSEGQQNLPSSPLPGAGSFPQETVPNPPYAGGTQGYGGSLQQQGGSPVQNQQLNPGTDATGWPNYPYPQYHNPYYGGISTRDLVSGTLEWLVSLPSTVFDRFSGFVDRNFFPQSPATQGGGTQPQTQTPSGAQTSPGTTGPLPPANVYGPGSR
ncbi:MAG: hypothetical protein WCG29_09340 [Desulfomonile sp.]|jgi:hypothetical protein